MDHPELKARALKNIEAAKAVHRETGVQALARDLHKRIVAARAQTISDTVLRACGPAMVELAFFHAEEFAAACERRDKALPEPATPKEPWASP